MHSICSRCRLIIYGNSACFNQLSPPVQRKSDDMLAFIRRIAERKQPLPVIEAGDNKVSDQLIERNHFRPTQPR